MPKEVLLGNEAIGYALAASGLSVMAAYPGTPSSEILPAVVRYNQKHNLGIYAEWSVNEKIALDQAFAGAMTGLRAACAMKQVGLNVAADSFFSIAYIGVIGGLIVVSADDPGPHSSQTEQDSRLLALAAKVPVFDPSSPAEAMAMIPRAFQLSERFQVPVLLRPGIRICHAKEAVNLPRPKPLERTPRFVKDPARWAATPRFRYLLHEKLNRKLAAISRLNDRSPFNRLSFSLSDEAPLGVLTAGAPAAPLADLLNEAGLADEVPVLQLGAPYPFPQRLVADFTKRCRRVLVVEETDAFIELLAPGREKMMGRLSGLVPSEGELTPEAVHTILHKALKKAGLKGLGRRPGAAYAKVLPSLDLPVPKPRLCPGCGHRAAFFAMRQAAPRAIFPSDIGCYTLGLNLRAVDTVLDMGSSVTLASGLYQALKRGEGEPVILATIGDSTFYHSGTASLINAVYNNARFVLVVLDNATTAMTGMQPTPDLGRRADGSAGRRVELKRLIHGCGVDYVETVDPYDVPATTEAIKKAAAHALSPEGSVAVVIAAHPCRIAYPDQPRLTVAVSDECEGCLICVKTFECPALSVPAKGEKAVIDPKWCVGCGVCVHACPQGALEVVDEA